MLLSEASASTNTIEKLIDVVVTLADYTHSFERCAEVPAFLSAALELHSVTLSVVRQSPDDQEPHILLCSSSQPGGNTAARDQALAFHRQTRASTQEDPSRIHAVSLDQAGEGGSSHRLNNPQQIFARKLDANHFMLMTASAHCEISADTFEQPNELLMIAQELSKQLICLISWQNSPQTLGAPFDRLTKREWTVLHALNTEASEKQLAHQLGQRPHTLHSHIKSIYQKVGVQGRLPLLQRLHTALRQMRIQAHNLHAHPTENQREELVS